MTRVVLAVSYDSPTRDCETLTETRLVRADGNRITKIYGRVSGWFLVSLNRFDTWLEYEYGDRGRHFFYRDLKDRQISIPLIGVDDVKADC